MQQYETARPAGARAAAIDEGLRAYMNRVYSLMGFAMLITGAVAYVVGNNEALLAALFSGPQRYLVMFAPLLVVFGLSAGINRLSASTAQLIFWGFSALMGLSISFIFAVYTGVSIAQTFLVTAIAFGGLSLYGYTTKKDLSAMGTFLIMGVIGLILASVINLFLASSALQFAISAIGVLIFAGLTAYDTQQIKNEYLGMSSAGPEGAAYMHKGAIMGALRLYLDFLNMFMFLLQFMGNRN